ncbi:DUF3943 domain-containing protein [Shewanella youngdeokensis]|uniref:DUF3943 domain-containing protein n=1 Tax=Shewanella youngdeokensis TaxID=2999068 RepID=A0ABZ0K2Z8_9GAMM|nr:DUF3943 domain-containing protein [Shewanella sp. DAU334]
MNIQQCVVLGCAALVLETPAWAGTALPPSDLVEQMSSNDVIPKSSVTVSPHTVLTPALTSPELIDKNWWGALAETTVLLTIGGGLYKATEDSMKDDFDYEIEGNAGQYFIDRLVTTDSWKLDDNQVGMNWGHAYAGALYHQGFRNYNFNYYESMLGNFAASTVWEVFAEYKEVVSINDQIVTTFGGSVLGESFFQLSQMLDAKEGWVPVSFAAVFNPSKTLRGWFGNNQPNRFDRLQAQDKFDIYTGVMYSSREAESTAVTTVLLGVEASIDSVQGQYDALSATPSLIELDMEVGISNAGIEDWQLASYVFLGGYTNEVKATVGLRESWGHSWFIGPAMGVQYSSLGQEDENEDFYAAINVIGLSIGAQWANADVSFKLRGDIFGDFSMVKPFATEGYRAAGGHFWGTKSVLWEGGYAYGLGHTATFKAEARYQELLFGVKLTSQRWDSIDDHELNRSNDWNPNKSDLDFKDTRDRYTIYLGIPLTPTFGLSMHYERVERRGTINGIDNTAIVHRSDDSENRTSLRFDYKY